MMTRVLCSEAIIFRLYIIMYVEIVRFRLYLYYIIYIYTHDVCAYYIRLYKRIRLFPSVLFVLPPFSVHYSCVVRDFRRGTGADTWNYQKPRDPRSWAVTDGRRIHSMTTASNVFSGCSLVENKQTII